MNSVHGVNVYVCHISVHRGGNLYLLQAFTTHIAPPHHVSVQREEPTSVCCACPCVGCEIIPLRAKLKGLISVNAGAGEKAPAGT